MQHTYQYGNMEFAELATSKTVAKKDTSKQDALQAKIQKVLKEHATFETDVNGIRQVKTLSKRGEQLIAKLYSEA